MSLPNPGMSFTPFDPLPASDLNDLVENIESLADGTGFNTGAIPTAAYADESVTAAKIANRTRSVVMPFFADGAAGAASSITQGMPAVAFSGTPTGFARANVVIPRDYVAGTDVTIRFKTYASNTATHTSRHYLNADAVGDSLASLWDIANNVQTTNLAYTANILKDIDLVVAAVNIAADSLLSMAWKIETAITGTVWVEHISLIYTADS